MARRRFAYAPLYLPDLEQIVTRAIARNLSVTISDDHHEYESLSDLRENAPPRLRKLSLHFSESTSVLRSVQLDIAPDGVTVAANKTDVLLAHWHEVVEIVQRRVPWYSKLLQPIGWGFLAFMFSSALTKVDPKNSTWYGEVGVFCAATFLSLLSFYYLRTFSGVHLKKEHEVTSLWEKYAEKIILLLIGALVGLAGKWIGDNFLSK